jgi:uncharacterized protein (DUF1697 family)
MARQIALLRGINLGSRNRVSMPDLRAALEAAGYEDVATLVQSGNIVLTSTKKPKTLEREISELVLDEFGVESATVVRTRDELAEVIERNPIPDGPSVPKLFQVTFFSGEPDAERVAELAAQDFGNERVEVIGREAYAWHPDGIQKSKLARELGKRLRADGTARNWNTVTKLLELADA